MFENVLGQSVTGRLIKDIETGILAPSILFSGPPASGKGTAALELGRVISCEISGDKRAAWNCPCPACARHRFLIHSDLLCLGRRPFSAEITASAKAFLRESIGVELSSSIRILFIRSIRKLLARFNPVLWEDEPKGKALFPLVSSLEEDLDELDSAGTEALPKLIEGMVKTAYKLESDGMSEYIPIGQLRRAAYWGRLAPSGRGKLLLIENADRMQEDARNSLLKLLEEPPGRLYILLATTRHASLLPTMLSRLRPYHFNSRDAAVEDEVIKRVFKDKNAESNSVSDYLDFFLPVSGATLEALAAFFAASIAFKASLDFKRQGRTLPPEVVLLGKYCAPKAEEEGLGRPRDDPGAVIKIILERAEKFEIRSLFSRFLSCLLEQVSLSLRNETDAPSLLFISLWRESVNHCDISQGMYNLRPNQVLEKLFIDLNKGMMEL